MKRIIIYSALALVVGVALLRVLQHDAGYVLIAVSGKTIEMRFWFAVFALFLCALILSTTLKLISRVLGAFSSGWNLAMASKATRGAQRTRSGFIQFIEGDWIGAQKSLLKAAKDVDQPLVHYLGAARSAYETGDFDQAETLISKAQKIAPNNKEAIALSQARMLFLSEKYDECLNVLHGVKPLLPSHPVVLDLLYKAYLALEDWKSLQSLLPSLEKSTFLSGEDFDRLQIQVYVSLLQQEERETVEALSNPETPLALGYSGSEVPTVSKEVRLEQHQVDDPLELVWQQVPKKLKKHPEVLAHYVSALQRTGRSTSCESLIQSVLKKSWSEDLVTLYGLLESRDSKAQLRVAQKWLNKNSESPALHLALGRICLRCELWGQAKEYLIASLDLKASIIVYAELARLQSSMGEFELSNKSYKEGLLAATGALPKLPQPSL